jgi:hypothetical protein
MKGCESREVIVRLPPLVVRGIGVVITTSVGPGPFLVKRGTPATRATRASTPAAARKIPVRFIFQLLKAWIAGTTMTAKAWSRLHV